MIKLLKNVLCILLTMMLVMSIATVGVSANSGLKEFVHIDDVGIDCETNTYYFYFRDGWKNKYNDYYDANTGLDSCAPAIYWWLGSFNCQDYGEAKGYPGYMVTQEVAPNIYKADVPKDVEVFMWTNGVYSGYNPFAPEIDAAYYTDAICATSYDGNDSEYGFYPQGVSTFDNMIYIVDGYQEGTDLEPVIAGEWFYYYGDGKYGYAPTLKEAGDEVYSNGEFPELNLRTSVDSVNLQIGESTAITTNISGVDITADNDDVISIKKNDATNEVAITGVSKGKATVTFTYSTDCIYRNALGTLTKTVKVNVTEPTYEIKSIKLSKNEYTYDGKKKTPKVTVVDTNGNKLEENRDFIAIYPTGRKNLGNYRIYIYFLGEYEESLSETYVDFKILPKGTNIKKINNSNNKLVIKWQKQKIQVSGYEVQYSTSPKMKKAKTKIVKGNNKSKIQLPNLKSNKTYYVRIRTYKDDKYGLKHYSKWSDIISKKTK